jgi:hypothetical protein
MTQPGVSTPGNGPTSPRPHKALLRCALGKNTRRARVGGAERAQATRTQSANLMQGPSCLATISLSLWDKTHSPPAIPWIPRAAGKSTQVKFPLFPKICEICG